MAFLGRMFGQKNQQEQQQHRPTAANAASTINTIQTLSDNEEQLDKRRALLEKRIDAELQKAREYNKLGKKPQALQALKRKKLLEGEIATLDNMIMRVIEQRSMLESQRTTVEVVSTMHTAAMTAKDNLKTMNVDRVDQVIDDINDTNEQMKQLQDVFAAPTGAAAGLDDDELLDELNELEGMELDSELAKPAPLPARAQQQAAAQQAGVPARKAQQAAAGPATPAQRVQKKTREEEELEALQAEMAS